MVEREQVRTRGLILVKAIPNIFSMQNLVDMSEKTKKKKKTLVNKPKKNTATSEKRGKASQKIANVAALRSIERRRLKILPKA